MQCFKSGMRCCAMSLAGVLERFSATPFSRIVDQAAFIPEPQFTEDKLAEQTGRVVVVTGGYSGVGLEITKLLRRAGAHVYIAGRTRAKFDAALTELAKDDNNNNATPAKPWKLGAVDYMEVDLSDMRSIVAAARWFAEQETRLDVLLNIAGVMLPRNDNKDADGHNIITATNILGPFLLTQQLLPLLQRTAAHEHQLGRPAGSVRVVWTASMATELAAPPGGVDFTPDGAPVAYPATGTTAYGQSKAANLLLASELARRQALARADGSLPAGGEVVSVAINPGNLATPLYRHFSSVGQLLVPLMFFPPYLGGLVSLYAGWSPDVGLDNNGCYVIPWGRLLTPRADIARGLKTEAEGGTGNAQKLWQWCENETKKYLN